MWTERAPSSALWPWTSTGVAVAGSLAVTVAVSPWVTALVVAAAGVVLVVTGLARRSIAVRTWGSVLVFGGVAVAAVAGADPGRTLAAGTVAVLAWESGRYAHTLAVACGPGASTGRVEVVHLATVGAGLSVVAGLQYLLFLQASGGRSLLSLLALLVGVFATFVALQLWTEGTRRRTAR